MNMMMMYSWDKLCSMTDSVILIISIFLGIDLGFTKSFGEGSSDKQFEETCTKECLVGVFYTRGPEIAY